MKIKDMTREDFLEDFASFLLTMEYKANIGDSFELVEMYIKTLEFEDDAPVKRTFEQWKVRVDDALFDLCGMESNMLPDYDYFAAWEAGDIPEECAEDVLEYVDRLNAK